jgi:hypothetical protein
MAVQIKDNTSPTPHNIETVLTANNVKDVNRPNRQHTNIPSFTQRITQQVWKHFSQQATHISSDVRNGVDLLLHEQLLSCQRFVQLQDLKFGINADHTHTGKMTDTAYEIYTGAAAVTCDDFNVNTSHAALHLKLNNTHTHTHITAVIIPTCARDVFVQHYLQSESTSTSTLTNLDSLFQSYGKHVHNNQLKFEKYMSHRTHRNALKQTHVLACENLGLPCDFTSTVCMHTPLFTAYHTPVELHGQGRCISLFW